MNSVNSISYHLGNTFVVTRYKFYFFKISVSVILLAYLFQITSVQLIVTKLKSIDPVYFVIACIFSFVQIIVNTIRWHQIIGNIYGSMTFRNVFLCYYASSFFNLFLPGTLGSDTYRILSPHDPDISLKQSANSVIIERVFSTFGLFILIIISIPLMISRTNSILLAYLFTIIGLFLVIIASVFLAFKKMNFINSENRVARLLLSIKDDWNRAIKNLTGATALLVFGTIPHILTIFAIYILALGLKSHITLWDCFAFLPSIFLIIMLPISLGGWGVREISMVTTFSYIGVTIDEAILLSVLIGALTIIVALPGGLIWIYSRLGTRTTGKE